ncbi:inositol monophosphatase family protein [Planctomyces sp. SH-PL62]|uniref:inositol monophosphatase family protein n=1 Tax=Planctomyces sp. SH-PL62 TaxID=1636152 RepID=UPI00078D765C|nr:inositol monophosphatase family protein [Planctomyces sp. SH-PL62]AMV36561.1 Inositol-1-monophosphatase [Planctomyces sp. SH-PL62]
MRDETDYTRELELVKDLAREAAELALKRSRSVTPVEKANNSYVTDLDNDLEKFIRARLGAAFPDDLLTGEEYAPEGGEGPRRWSIDPIDGTGNLVHGLPLWAVSIGLIEADVPVLGVIAVPPLGELYWAVKGQGAFRDGERLRVKDADAFHLQDNVCLGTNAMRKVDPRSMPGRLRDLGSACCEQVFVASGRLKASVFLGEQAHDVAAGVVIAGEAGCVFGTLEEGRLEATDVVMRTPIAVPTFVAPPRLLDAMLKSARPYPAPKLS